MQSFLSQKNNELQNTKLKNRLLTKLLLSYKPISPKIGTELHLKEIKANRHMMTLDNRFKSSINIKNVLIIGIIVLICSIIVNILFRLYYNNIYYEECRINKLEKC